LFRSVNHDSEPKVRPEFNLSAKYRTWELSHLRAFLNLAPDLPLRTLINVGGDFHLKGVDEIRMAQRLQSNFG